MNPGICIFNYEDIGQKIANQDPSVFMISGLKSCAATDFIIEINNLANELIQGIGVKLHELNSKVGSSASPAMVTQMINFFMPETRSTSDLDHQTLANLSLNLNSSRIQLFEDVTNITNVRN